MPSFFLLVVVLVLDVGNFGRIARIESHASAASLFDLGCLVIVFVLLLANFGRILRI